MTRWHRRWQRCARARPTSWSSRWPPSACSALEGGGRAQTSGELRPLTEKIPALLAFDDIVGDAPEFRAALAVAAKAARARVSVLLEGEGGVGKESLAEAIHAASPRRSADAARQLRRHPRQPARQHHLRP
jgi:transcriptional regulator of acetoin/glycerol metabolism